MLLIEKEIEIPKHHGNSSLLDHFDLKILSLMNDGETPVRFVVTKSDNKS